MTLRARFGVVVRTAASAGAWREKVRRYEDLGFDVVYVPDHLVGDRLAPLVALAAAAEATTTLRLGTMVLANDFRHPVVLAKEAASLDVLSGGRLELGIGTGWMRADYDRSGIAHDPPRTRVERLRETLAILRGAWGAAPFTMHGDHYRVDQLDLRPKPVQNHLPILVGAGGPVMLELAATHADVVNITNQTDARGEGIVDGEIGLDVLRGKVSHLRSVAGDRWGDLEVSVSVQAVAVDQPVTGLRARSAYLADAADRLLDTPYVLHGSVASIVDDLARWREELAVRLFVIHDEVDADAAARVIAAARG